MRTLNSTISSGSDSQILRFSSGIALRDVSNLYVPPPTRRRITLRNRAAKSSLRGHDRRPDPFAFVVVV
jgi:hypothetical protein